MDELPLLFLTSALLTAPRPRAVLAGSMHLKGGTHPPCQPGWTGAAAAPAPAAQRERERELICRVPRCRCRSVRTCCPLPCVSAKAHRPFGWNRTSHIDRHDCTRSKKGYKQPIPAPDASARWSQVIPGPGLPADLAPLFVQQPISDNYLPLKPMYTYTQHVHVYVNQHMCWINTIPMPGSQEDVKNFRLVIKDSRSLARARLKNHVI